MTEMLVRDIGHHEVLVGLWTRWTCPPGAPAVLPGGAVLLADRELVDRPGARGAALNLAPVVGMLVVSRRRGGTPLVLCTLVAAGCWPARWGRSPWATRGT